jgi:L-malate glycosyltransferase
LKILLCAEFFYPSVGGAQEVVKQLALRLAALGHDVSVATTYLPNRVDHNFQGVKIVDFKISGNLSRGMVGEVRQYQDYVNSEKFDLIFIYAAQQWTFDALWDVLHLNKSKKIFVPCGYSGLYDAAYANYFSCLAEKLRLFDALIYHAKNYRDYAYGLEHHLNQCFLVPNAADNSEFNVPPVPSIRKNLGITDGAILFLTVGSLNGAKGHLELLRVLSLIKSSAEITLLLNGNKMPVAQFSGVADIFNQIIFRVKRDSVIRALKSLIIFALKKVGFRKDYFSRMDDLIRDINCGKYGKNKKVYVTNYSRSDLISAYFESDLFLFASNVEYSPLVLFEACAAGLPFVSGPAGNAQEIAQWTRGGVVCKAKVDKLGNVHVDEQDMANEVEKFIAAPELRIKFGDAGRLSWQARFNWDDVAREYLKIFEKVMNEPEKV